MQREVTEGILLKTTPYLQKGSIARVFTKDLGLISVMLRKKAGAAVLHPLTRGELLLKRSAHTEIFALEDFSLVSYFEELRKNLSYLKAFGKMAQALLSTQQEERGKEKVYLLFVQFLSYLPKCPEGSSLAASFQLKLLKQEGFLHLEERCSRCLKPACSLSYGESLCCDHAQGSLFSKEDWAVLFLLTFSRKLFQIANLSISPALSQRVEDLFFNCTQFASRKNPSYLW